MEYRRTIEWLYGKDMNDVLSGKKRVEFTFWSKLRYKINNFLKMFN